MGGGLIRGTIGGLIGGLIGAAVWAGITYFTSTEIGWIAWGIGLVTGLGVRVMCSDEGGVSYGVVAAGIAVLSIVVGKYAAIELLLNDELSAFAESGISEEDMIVGLADEVVMEWQDDGKPMEWPDGMSVEEAYAEEDYPADVWQEARTRWDAIGSDQQQQQIAERQAETEAAMDELMDLVRKEAFKDSFSGLDIVFFLLAVVTAFKVGAGDGSEGQTARNDDEPEDTDSTA